MSVAHISPFMGFDSNPLTPCPTSTELEFNSQQCLRPLTEIEFQTRVKDFRKTLTAKVVSGKGQKANSQLESVYKVFEIVTSKKNPFVKDSLRKKEGYLSRLFSKESWPEWLENQTALGKLVALYIDYLQSPNGRSLAQVQKLDPALVEKADNEASVVLKGILELEGQEASQSISIICRIYNAFCSTFKDYVESKQPISVKDVKIHFAALQNISLEQIQEAVGKYSFSFDSIPEKADEIAIGYFIFLFGTQPDSSLLLSSLSTEIGDAKFNKIRAIIRKANLPLNKHYPKMALEHANGMIDTLKSKISSSRRLIKALDNVIREEFAKLQVFSLSPKKKDDKDFAEITRINEYKNELSRDRKKLIDQYWKTQKKLESYLNILPFYTAIMSMLG